MRLEDLPRLLPGADTRISLKRKLCFVTVTHEGRVGNAAHKELTFALRHAVGDLKARSALPEQGGSQ